jgi:hypothetical protein
MSGVVKRPTFLTEGRHRDVGTVLEAPNGSFKIEVNITKMLDSIPTNMLEELYDQLTKKIVERKQSGR